MLITENLTSNSLVKQLGERLIENEDIFKIVSLTEIENLNSGQSQEVYRSCGGCGGGGCGGGDGISDKTELNEDENVFRITSINFVSCYEKNQHESLDTCECGSCGEQPATLY